MENITFEEFEKVELVVGTIVAAQPFTEAHRPAYIIQADFGSKIGSLKSSAQITTRYKHGDLIGRQIIGIVNLPPKQIGPIRSQFLITGFHCKDGSVVLAQPEQLVPNGTKLT